VRWRSPMSTACASRRVEWCGDNDRAGVEVVVAGSGCQGIADKEDVYGVLSSAGWIDVAGSARCTTVRTAATPLRGQWSAPSTARADDIAPPRREPVEEAEAR
jgi:hypothetical protein